MGIEGRVLVFQEKTNFLKKTEDFEGRFKLSRLNYTFLEKFGVFFEQKMLLIFFFFIKSEVQVFKI